jgi:hypothetical protein|tara:strand:+ start:4649 stop:5368 length:720 start_codon:yes stop_codon:yes gene_type:complete
MGKLITIEPEITENNLVEFNLTDAVNSDLVNSTIPLTDLEASSDIMLLVLGQTPYTAFVKGSVIGYGDTTNITEPLGVTEEQAYNTWLAEFKRKEKKFKSDINLNIDSLSQTVYDSLLASYVMDGHIGKIESAYRTFEFTEDIRNNDWQRVATAFSLTDHRPEFNKRLATVMMLADYGDNLTRDQHKINATLDIRKSFPDLFQSDIARAQAEVVYFLNTNRFLPKLSQTRMRDIVKATS